MIVYKQKNNFYQMYIMIKQMKRQKDQYMELADVVNYCILMADKLDVDLEDIVLKKLKKTEKKYPVEKAEGNSKKYNQL